MIDRIKLTNFRVFDSRDLKLEKITTFVGPSDSGKTSLLTALGWVCFNQPSGDAFIRDGESFARVSILCDGRTITRQRGKENLYKLDGKPLSAFGKSGVPEDIEKVLSVSDLNFQWQLDEPFLLTDTPGNISKALNKIINLGAIDDAMSKAAQQSRKAQSVLAVVESRVSEAREKKRELAPVVEMDAALKAIEAKERDAEALRGEFRRLSSVIEELEPLDAAIEVRERAVDRFAAIEAKYKAVKKDRISYDKLCGLITQIESIDAKIGKGKIPDIRTLEESVNRVIKLREKHNSICTIIERLEEVEAQLCKAEKSYTAALAEEKQLRGRPCPLCGNPPAR